MRKKVIAGNWKMHKTENEIKEYMDGLQTLETADHTTAIICAPFVYLPALVEQAKGTTLQIAAQNMHFENSGAFTGEVSPMMLKDIGVTYVIIGHSERRANFNETDETVNQKVHAAFEHGLIPIVCVGETLEQRENKETLAHIEKQVTKALSGLSEELIVHTIIAYEPIWAIGTGKTASSADANEVCGYIREIVGKISSKQVAEKVVVQYGGSVKPENIEELLAATDIDGALVGGASLEAASFATLVEAGNNCP